MSPLQFLCVAAVIATLSGLLPAPVQAVPAAAGVHLLMQPDGATIKARLWGDERQHGWETPTGRTIVRDDITQQWSYAVTDSMGSLISSGVRVVTDDSRSQVEQGFEPHARPQPDTPLGGPQFFGPPNMIPRFQTTNASIGILTVSPTGAANVPVILINFNNTATTNTAAQFNSLLFGTGTHSMSDYYREVSYGKFSVGPGPSGVVGWYRATNTHDYYGANVGGNDAWPGDLVYEAVAAADAVGFNFAAYDQDGDCYVDVIAIVHQGSGEEAGGPATDIWSHSWNLNSAQYWGNSHSGAYTTKSTCLAGGYVKVNDYVIQPERLWSGMQTIGVFAHEYGHALGLPDLYDTDGTSEGDGNWTLMASGSWNYVVTAGDRPAHLDPWSKYRLGWIAPTLVSSTLTNEPISAVNAATDVYQFRSGSPAAGGEYFLVENRQQSGFDAGLPGAGLLIWYIDEARATSNNRDNAYECYPGGPACASQHYRVAVVQADSQWELERKINRGDAGDPYPGATGKTVFNATSAPNSNLYIGAASNVCVTAISAAAPTMTATLGCATSSPLVLSVTKTGSGTVTSTPLGINCGSDCSESYSSGATVTLTAVAASGSTFASWFGCTSTAGASCTVVMNSTKTVTATFAATTGVAGLFAAVLPYARSVQVGQPATAFGTLINATGVEVTHCHVALPASPPIPATFNYQTTNASNQLVGTPNTPVNIPAGGAQSFVFGITPSSAFAATDIPLVFDCANTQPAPSQMGLNNFLLSASSTPVPDMIAIGATPTGDGVLRIPGPTAIHAFATAAINIGGSGAVTATVDTGGVTLPLTLSLCQTDPGTGGCLSPPAPSVSGTVNTQQAVTYAVFAQASGVIPFDPAGKRIFLRLASGGVVRGATSVAVTTE